MLFLVPHSVSGQNEPYWSGLFLLQKENLPFRFILLFLFIYLFILAVLGLCCCTRVFSKLRREGATLCCSAQASNCSGFSCCRAQALGARASVVVVRGLCSCGSRGPEHRLSNCGAWAPFLRSMWDLTGPGLESVSPALAGGFLTTEPQRKPFAAFF